MSAWDAPGGGDCAASTPFCSLPASLGARATSREQRARRQRLLIELSLLIPGRPDGQKARPIHLEFYHSAAPGFRSPRGKGRRTKTSRARGAPQASLGTNPR